MNYKRLLISFIKGILASMLLLTVFWLETINPLVVIVITMVSYSTAVFYYFSYMHDRKEHYEE